MTITNLTVTDKGETIEVKYTLTDGNTTADIEQQISKKELDCFHPYWYYTGRKQVVHSYLNQNLK